MKDKKIILLVIFGLSLLVFFFYHKDYQKNPSYLSGDEPHYVMMTDSLVRDGDFNLKNDYEEKRSTKYYAGPPLYPHISPLINQDSDEWYSIHTIGLPLIFAGPYKLAGVLGVRVFMILLQLSLLPLFYLILKKYLSSTKRALLGSTLLAVCPLYWQNLGSLFPDLLLVTLAAAAILLFGKKDRVSNIAIIFLGVLSALVHSKGLVFIGPVIVGHIAWLIYSDGFLAYMKCQWLSLVLGLVSVLGYAQFLYTNYGIFSPSQLYGNNGQLFRAHPAYNIIAMLTDRNKGLFVHFPLLLVVIPYFVMLLFALQKFAKKIPLPKTSKVRLTQNTFIIFSLLTAFLLLGVTLIGFNDWSGSTAPNGRSLMPAVLAAIFLVAKYINLKNRVEVIVLGISTALCTWLTWISINDFKYYMSPGANSFWVDRFHPLANLPMFDLVATKFGRDPAIRGLKVLVLVLVINLVLLVIYRYEITFKKRRASGDS